MTRKMIVLFTLFAFLFIAGAAATAEEANRLRKIPDQFPQINQFRCGEYFMFGAINAEGPWILFISELRGSDTIGCPRIFPSEDVIVAVDNTKGVPVVEFIDQEGDSPFRVRCFLINSF